MEKKMRGGGAIDGEQSNKGKPGKNVKLMGRQAGAMTREKKGREEGSVAARGGRVRTILMERKKKKILERKRLYLILRSS